MKKLLFMAAMSSLMLASCSNEPSFTINGTTPENMPDGSYAYLRKGDFNTVVDSMLVKDHTFTFKGRQDSIESHFVSYKVGKKLSYASFYLENAVLNVALGEKVSKVSGTPINEAASTFAEANMKIIEEIKEIRKEMYTDTATEEGNKVLAEKIQQLKKNQKELISQTIRENINNYYGAAMVANSGAYFSIEEQMEWIKQLPEALKNDKIKEVEKHLAIMENTAVGKKFTDFTMKDPEGKDVKLSEFVAKNKITMVDFWASWCGPCRKEMKNFKKAYEHFHNMGFGVVGVSLDKDAEQWKKAIEEEKIEWDNMSDLKGWECEGAKLYGIGGIPATLLINQEGIIVARNLRGQQLEEKLKEVFH